VADKYNEHPPGRVGSAVEALESVRAAGAVEYVVVFELLQGTVGGQVVVRSHDALKVERVDVVDAIVGICDRPLGGPRDRSGWLGPDLGRPRGGRGR